MTKPSQWNPFDIHGWSFLWKNRTLRFLSVMSVIMLCLLWAAGGFEIARPGTILDNKARGLYEVEAIFLAPSNLAIDGEWVLDRQLNRRTRYGREHADVTLRILGERFTYSEPQGRFEGAVRVLQDRRGTIRIELEPEGGDAAKIHRIGVYNCEGKIVLGYPRGGMITSEFSWLLHKVDVSGEPP